MSNKKNGKFFKPNDDYVPSGDSTVLVKNIEELGLSEYTLSKLKSVEILTINDLCKCQMKHLYRIDGFGKKNVFEVLKKLQAVGLDFKRAPKAEQLENTPIEKSQEKVEVITEKPQKQEKPQSKKQDKNKQEKNNQKKDKKLPNEKPQQNNRAGQKPTEQQDKKDNKKSDNKAEQFQKSSKDNFKAKNVKPQEPKRLKVNSYDIDAAFEEDSMTKTRNLKQERQAKIAKKISELPPIKNKDGLYKFYKHGKWGYKNEQGKVVIEPTYMEAFNFKEGLACVEIDEKCGFINLQGELVVPMIYDTACSFSEGLASVTKDEKCGYIDKEGNVVFDFIYEAATSFENDISLVKLNGKWGYMDRKTGEIRLR